MSEYKIEIEIFEGKGGQLRREDGEIVYPDLERKGICAWMYRGDGEQSYQQGQKFTYPDDVGKMCIWLMDSMNGFIRALRYGGTLGWDYEGTPYDLTRGRIVYRYRSGQSPGSSAT